MRVGKEARSMKEGERGGGTCEISDFRRWLRVDLALVLSQDVSLDDVTVELSL
jgi:hypothetical protein